MANERLYQFPSKASPVPADIIYAGVLAAGFDEVNITIAQLISAYPNLSGIGGLTLGNNTFIYANGSAVLTAGEFQHLPFHWSLIQPFRKCKAHWAIQRHLRLHCLLDGTRTRT